MIFFNVPQAKKQLIEFGLVYTLRSGHRGTGRTFAVSGTPPQGEEYLGLVYVTRVTEDVTAYNSGGYDSVLFRYLEHSGFDSIQEWLAAASPSARTLYRVEKVSDEETK